MHSRRHLLLVLVAFAISVVFHRHFFPEQEALASPLASPPPPPVAGSSLAVVTTSPPPLAPPPPPPSVASTTSSASAFFGAQGPIDLAEIPPGPFRDSLERLSPADRFTALAHLAASKVARSQISTLRATASGGLLHICPPGPHHPHAGHVPASADPPVEADIDETTSSADSTTPVAAPVPISSPPALSSRQGASRILYLDFNGHTVTGTEWNNPNNGGRSRYDALPYDTDGNRGTFSDDEQAVIREVWARVAEDFAPFDLNVTTVEPSSFTATTGRVVITQAVDASGNYVPGGQNAGGVAYLNVFNTLNYVSTYSPAWAVADNVGATDAANIAEVVSHEFGHNLGLSHDGTSDRDYYEGHGSGATSWGPIMGAAYGRNITTFNRGDYYRANNSQDDLAIIAAKVPYRSDDVADTDNGAVPLAGSGASASARIERNTDADRFRLTNGGGRLVVSIRAFSAASGPRGNNLDLVAEILDASGDVVGSYSNDETPDLDIDAAVSPGTYYLRIRPTGIGNPAASSPSGYTVYGSLGEYTVTNNTNSVPPPSILVQPVSVARPLGSTHTFTVVADATATRYQWRFNGAPISGATSASLALANLSFARAGTYACAVSNASATTLSQPASLGVYRATAQNLTVNPGANATFPTLVAGAFDNLSWSREGQPINRGDDPRVIPSGATLRINGVLHSDAATYVLAAAFAGESVPVGPVTLVVRPPVVLSVPATVTAYRGEVPDIPITSSHNNLTYRFSGLPAGLGYVPTTGALTSSGLGPALGAYAITLTGTDPFANAGSVAFTLVIEARSISVSVPATLATYTLVAPSLAATTNAASPTYHYAGLPAGYSFDSTTGRISRHGKPPAPGTYPVTLTVSDPFANTGSATFDLVIESLPPDRLVTQAGLLARDTILNQNLGGSFTLKPVFSNGRPTGAYTGVLNAGTLRYALAGRLATGGPGTDLTADLTATAKGRSPLALELTLPADSAAPATGQLAPLGGAPFPLQLWSTPYTKKNPATPFVGKHVFALFPPEDAAPSAPAGIGLGTLSITAAGKASWTTRLADGTPLTGSVPLGLDGYVPLFSRIAKPGGSLLGPLSLSSADRSLDGSLSWLRSPAPAKTYASTALYRDGFGPLSLTVLGGPPSPPPAGTRVLGLPDSSPNARLSFLGAGLSDEHLSQLALPPLTVTTKNTVSRPTSAAANPAALSLSLKPGSASFNGSFVLKDPNPLKPGASVSRKVSYQGVLLDGRGVGFFLLPGLKTSASEAPTTLSGSVLLEPLPPAE